MSSGRRFNEREIREVFERAAAGQERAARRGADDGLTVEEMQEVAASAGIAPEFVAAAARAVALGEPETGRETFGPVPVGVSRTEFLPGPPADALWEGLVADLRHTFRATGETETVGRLREWRNGNLRVSLEPSGDGSRLRLRTRRGDVRSTLGMAAVAAIMGAVLTTLAVLSWGDLDTGAFVAALTVLTTGLASAAATWTRQRRWATTREGQMAAVAERAAAASAAVADPPATEPLAAPAPGRLDLDGLGDALAEPDRQRARRRTR